MINGTLFRANYVIEDGSRFQHRSVRVGPSVDEADFWPQVLGLLGVTLAPNASFSWGARAGFAPTCLEGGDGGDGGKDINVQFEAFARYFPLEPSRFRPFLEGGPFAARTCHGSTYDQGIAELGGLHVGGGGEYHVLDGVSLHLAFRGLVSWGRYAWFSHGEVGAFVDASDLRFGLQFGMTFWLDQSNAE